MLKRGIAYVCKYTGKRDLFNCAVIETVLPNVSHPVRNLEVLEMFTIQEHPFLDHLQCGGELDALYRAVPETPFADVLHAAWNFNVTEFIAATEHLLLNSFQRGRELDVPNSATCKNFSL